MKYLHDEFEIGPGDVVEVTLDGQANVLLLDASNYERYRRGATYQYHGGFARASPYQLSPPTAGHWHLVVNLGGFNGQVKAGVRLLPGVNAAK